MEEFIKVGCVMSRIGVVYWGEFVVVVVYVVFFV